MLALAHTVLAQADVVAAAGSAAENTLVLQDFQGARSSAEQRAERYQEPEAALPPTDTDEPNNRAELELSLERRRESPVEIGNGSGLAYEAVAYTPTLLHNWRLIAGAYRTHEEVLEGPATYLQDRAGVEWHSGRQTLTALATYNDYDDSRLGWRGEGAWALSKSWKLEGTVEDFAKDTPLRALINGVTANAAEAELGWHRDETRSASLKAGVMTFSDHNRMTSLGSEYEQRLWSRDPLTLQGELQLEGSSATRSDVDYYSPRRDLLASAGLELTQVLLHRHDLSWEQGLGARAGSYWEHDFGQSFAGSLSYRQKLEAGPAFELELGLSLERRHFDAEVVTSQTASLSLTWKPG